MNLSLGQDDINQAYLGLGYQARLFNPTPREVCREIGLNWIAALRLGDSGWLSFDPETKTSLEEPEETELRFLGALVAFGFDENQLKIILEGLTKPYCYRIERIYFDWLKKRWRLLPSPPNADDIRDLIEQLQQNEEIEELYSLQSDIENAPRELGAIEAEEGEESI